MYGKIIELQMKKVCKMYYYNIINFNDIICEEINKSSTTTEYRYYFISYWFVLSTQRIYYSNRNLIVKIFSPLWNLET